MAAGDVNIPSSADVSAADRATVSVRLFAVLLCSRYLVELSKTVFSGALMLM